MAKRVEHIVGLHNLFPTAIERIEGVDERYYDLSVSLDYNQSVTENTVLFVDADSEDVNKYIHINSTFKRIRPGDNYIITEGKVYSNNFSIEGQYIPSYIKGPKGEPGKDGINGVDGKDGINGVDGKDGINGVDGKDGLTPSIGSNGNWWIGSTDTGVKASYKAGNNIDIWSDGTITAKGYTYSNASSSFTEGPNISNVFTSFNVQYNILLDSNGVPTNQFTTNTEAGIIPCRVIMLPSGKYMINEIKIDGNIITYTLDKRITSGVGGSTISLAQGGPYGTYSHIEGDHTITTNSGEHAEGKYNFSNIDTISSIGIGTSISNRKNAFEVMQNGDTFIYGAGGYDGTNTQIVNVKGERLPASVQEILPLYNKEKRSICFHYNETDGSYNQADGYYSFVTGYNNKAHFQQDMLQAGNSFVGGDSNNAYHQNTLVFGKKLFTQWANTFVLGKYNATVSNHDGWGDNVLGVVGDGYEDSNGNVTGRNVLLLQGGGDPALHCRGGFKNNASWINDFGEYFEWLDGNPDNEDRIGYMVQLNGDKIELATSLKKCIGIISGTTGFIGGVCAFEWHNKFLHDKWGREVIGEDGNPVINPDYNPELEYIPREQRKEWDVVGLVGQVITRQDGTLEVGGYAGCSNGIATNATRGFKVLKIIDNETALLLVK